MLAPYSAKFWGYHARKTGERMANISQVIIGLLSVEKLRF